MRERERERVITNVESERFKGFSNLGMHERSRFFFNLVILTMINLQTYTGQLGAM